MAPLAVYGLTLTAALVVFGYPAVAARRGLSVGTLIADPPPTLLTLCALSVPVMPALAWVSYSWIHALTLIPVAALSASLSVVILRSWAQIAALSTLLCGWIASIILYARL